MDGLGGGNPKLTRGREMNRREGREFPYYKMKNESRPRRMDRLMNRPICEQINNVSHKRVKVLGIQTSISDVDKQQRASQDTIKATQPRASDATPEGALNAIKISKSTSEHHRMTICPA